MKIASLIHYTAWDRFVMAPFSRPFVWTPHKVVSLFDSLYQGYPIGEIVLWAPAPSQTEPNKSHPTETIVDGVQRIAAIYCALRGIKPSFTPEKTITSCPLCFNVMSEQFAVLDPKMANDPEWINLVEFFAPKTPATGQVICTLYPIFPKDGSFEQIARRVTRLAGILDRSICVQYMPGDASADDCQEVRRLIHENGN